MSARATRPRSRRGRHIPPGELDPVAESLEEAEAANGSPALGPLPSQESCKTELLGPGVEESGQSLESRTEKEADEDSSRGLAPAPKEPHEPAEEAHQAPETAPWDRETVSSGSGAPDVFQTLQHALSSLEAAAAAWRHQPPSCSGPMEAEARGDEGPAWSRKGQGATRGRRPAWPREMPGCVWPWEAVKMN